jgi:outer membrane lipoprotein SlyB
VPRASTLVVAILSMMAACQAVAQMKDVPPRDAGVSVVIRCKDCGTVESIREVQESRNVLPAGSTTPAGVASAQPIGLVMYIPLGRKTGTDSPYVGSVGTRQWQQRTSSTQYEFTVRMDDGSFRFVPRQGVSDFAAGDRVKVTELQIEHWNE